MGFLLGLVPSFIPPKFRKAAVFITLALLVLAILGAAKCAYDRSIIKAHDAQREAAIAKADRKADARAAEQRRTDDARISTESQEIKEAINEARAEGRDPRAAYYECIGLQQAARRERKPPPQC
jgi:hypothetical protein